VTLRKPELLYSVADLGRRLYTIAKEVASHEQKTPPPSLLAGMYTNTTETQQ